MKKLRIAAAGAVLAVSASVLLVGPPAQAALSQCGSSRACAWTEPNYGGPFGSWTTSRSNLQTVGFGNNISSMANNRTRSIGWFSETGYTGALFSQPAGGAGFFNFPDPRADTFSSLFLY
ncbi:peptidase inhibitor family I36 protein [Marisediminicola senii]|uniref:peptidase inhibitor family I36 protein n=1 Tax=Marisediminicola senii TaxID=2711233 RepID=UPI0038B3CF7D